MKKNRNHSSINRLPSHIRQTVDEMIKSDFTYHEIVNYIRENGEEISISSVQRYASNLNETLESLRLARENFQIIMEESTKIRDLDASDAILTLLQNQIFRAINNLKPEQTENIDLEKLIRNSVAVTRATSYKKKIDSECKSVLSQNAEDFDNLIFQAMADENPELYEEIKKFVEEKVSQEHNFLNGKEIS